MADKNSDDYILNNQLETAYAKLITQYKNSPKFKKYLAAFVNQVQQLQDVFVQLLDLRSLDTAVGAQLDIIGVIVGQSRNIGSVNILNFFGFQGKLGARQFEDGLFWDGVSPTTGNILLDDATYLKFIKAKIIKNRISCTLPEIIEVVRYIFDGVPAFATDGNMHITVYIGKNLTDTEKAILKVILPSGDRLIAKPAGVKMDFIEFDPTSPFGFLGMPRAKGFDEGIFSAIV